MPANSDYHIGPGGDVPDSFRYTSKEKLSRKLMVGMAISPRGISKPAIMPSKADVGGHITVRSAFSTTRVLQARTMRVRRSSSSKMPVYR